MFSQKNCGLCCYSLSFSMPLIFTLLAVNISHFHTTTIKFLCCIFNEICLLCFSSLALVLLCYPLQPRRLNFVEKETALLFFSSLNVWVTKMTLKWTSVITKLSKEPRLTPGMEGKAKQHKDFGR